MTNQSEFCLLCSSKNHLVVDALTEAWECWNCCARYWLDDQARLEYCIFYDVDFAAAERDLKEYHLNSMMNNRIPHFAPTQREE